MADTSPSHRVPDVPAREAHERALMDRIYQGDADALEELLKMEWGRLVGYVTSIVDSRDTAEDIAQETFLRLWERRSDWRPLGSPAALIFKIARNLAFNQQRWREIRTRAQGTLLHLERTNRRKPTPLDTLEASEMQVALKRAIAALPPRRREVFLLGYLQDFSYREIAQLIGISTNTVANQMTLALKQLRGQLTSLLK